MSALFKVVHYERDGKDIFQEWFDGLRDLQARTAVGRRIKRIEAGNFGVQRPCGGNVRELVINMGPGYRVYYSVVEDVVVLLLCGGDKSTQKKDINRAIEYLKEFLERN